MECLDGLHQSRMHDAGIDQITLSELIEEIKRLLHVAVLNECSHEIVVDDGVSCMAVVGHLMEEVDDFPATRPSVRWR